MNIECDKEKTIYRNEVNGKVLYSLQLSKKKQDGNWENGYMSCSFPKNADIPNKTKIKIVQSWLDFYVKDRITHPYIFINKYEIVDNEIPQNTKCEYDEKSDIQITDEDIDKTFNNNLELPF